MDIVQAYSCHSNTDCCFNPHLNFPPLIELLAFETTRAKTSKEPPHRMRDNNTIELWNLQFSIIKCNLCWYVEIGMMMDHSFLSAATTTTESTRNSVIKYGKVNRIVAYIDAEDCQLPSLWNGLAIWTVATEWNPTNGSSYIYFF